MAERLKHDQIFRKAMENPLVAHEFFDAHLPKHIKDLVDCILNISSIWS